MYTFQHRDMTPQEVQEVRAFYAPEVGRRPLRDALIAIRMMFIRLHNDAVRTAVRESRGSW